MQINFDDAADFVAEVKDVVDDIDGGVVRLHVEKQALNDALTAYGVRAGFLVNGDLHQLVMECGVDPPRPGTESGKDIAERISALIREGCKDVVTIRKGVFVG